MNALVKITGGRTFTVPGVHWRPERTTADGRTIPAGCYVMESSIRNKLEARNRMVVEEYVMPDLVVDVDRTIRDIECSEIPFDIIKDGDESEDSIIMKVPYGMYEDFWKNHA